jgi:hypothetical protein
MVRLARSTNSRKKPQKSHDLEGLMRLAMISIIVGGLVTIAAISLHSTRNLDLKCGVEGCHLQVNGGNSK